MACGCKMWLLNDICQIAIAHTVVSTETDSQIQTEFLEINL